MVYLSCKYHRNGCAGAGYYVVRYRFRADGRVYVATAIVFDAAEHIAITADDGAVSFRYEDHAPHLRTFIESATAQAQAFG